MGHLIVCGKSKNVATGSAAVAVACEFKPPGNCRTLRSSTDRTAVQFPLGKTKRHVHERQIKLEDPDRVIGSALLIADRCRLFGQSRFTNPQVTEFAGTIWVRLQQSQFASPWFLRGLADLVTMCDLVMQRSSYDEHDELMSRYRFDRHSISL